MDCYIRVITHLKGVDFYMLTHLKSYTVCEKILLKKNFRMPTSGYTAGKKSVIPPMPFFQNCNPCALLPVPPGNY